MNCPVDQVLDVVHCYCKANMCEMNEMDCPMGSNLDMEYCGCIVDEECFIYCDESEGLTLDYDACECVPSLCGNYMECPENTYWD